MTPDQIDLARRLVACPRWRWVPGMRVTRPDGTFPLRVVAVVGKFTAAHEEHAVGDAVGACRGVWQSDVPDLTDPATAGCLLAMLVAVDPGAGWGVSCGPDVGWRATSYDHDLSGATCGDAVARALLVVWEAAP